MKRLFLMLFVLFGLFVARIALAVPTATPTPSIVGNGGDAYLYQKTPITSASAGLVVKTLTAPNTIHTYTILSLATNTTSALCDWFSTSPPPALPSDNAFEVTPGEWLDDSMSYGPAWLGMVCWTKSGTTPITFNSEQRQ